MPASSMRGVNDGVTWSSSICSQSLSPTKPPLAWGGNPTRRISAEERRAIADAVRSWRLPASSSRRARTRRTHSLARPTRRRISRAHSGRNQPTSGDCLGDQAGASRPNGEPALGRRRDRGLLVVGSANAIVATGA
jgi:hypothetical protein